MAITSEDYGKVMIASLTSSILSIAGCLFIIFFYFRYKEFRSFAFSLIFYLSVVDLCEALIHVTIPLVFENQNQTLCTIHGFLANYFNLSSVFWTSVMAISIYLLLYKPRTELDKYKKIFFLYALGLPLIISALPFIKNSYGPSPGWCWIKTEQDLQLKILFTIIDFYGPLWLVFISNFFLYWKSSKIIRRLGKSEVLKVVAKLKYYPFILVICWTAGTVHRIYTLFDDPKVWMIILNCFFGGLQGFFNALAYGSTENVKKELRIIWVGIKSKFKNIPIAQFEAEEKLLSADDSTQTDQEKKSTVSPDVVIVDKQPLEINNKQDEAKFISPENFSPPNDPVYYQSAILDETSKRKDVPDLPRMSHHTKSN